ncbi:hypothetical protein F4802DRAFT_618330 [Xylaria palmicola]|nr:hypothetical protein F4802DRAFT_618330 [Xylaria palmicola]
MSAPTPFNESPEAVRLLFRQCSDASMQRDHEKETRKGSHIRDTDADRQLDRYIRTGFVVRLSLDGIRQLDEEGRFAINVYMRLRRREYVNLYWDGESDVVLCCSPTTIRRRTQYVIGGEVVGMPTVQRLVRQGTPEAALPFDAAAPAMVKSFLSLGKSYAVEPTVEPPSKLRRLSTGPSTTLATAPPSPLPSGQNNMGQVNIGQVLGGQVNMGQVLGGQVNMGQVLGGQVNMGQVLGTQVNIGQALGTQVNMGQALGTQVLGGQNSVLGSTYNIGQDYNFGHGQIYNFGQDNNFGQDYIGGSNVIQWYPNYHYGGQNYDMAPGIMAQDGSRQETQPEPAPGPTSEPTPDPAFGFPAAPAPPAVPQNAPTTSAEPPAASTTNPSGTSGTEVSGVSLDDSFTGAPLPDPDDSFMGAPFPDLDDSFMGGPFPDLDDSFWLDILQMLRE